MTELKDRIESLTALSMEQLKQIEESLTPAQKDFIMTLIKCYGGTTEQIGMAKGVQTFKENFK